MRARSVRAVVERVRGAEVIVEGSTVAAIGPGLLVYVGIDHQDGGDDVAYLADKIAHLRVFPDSIGRLHLDVNQVHGAVLMVSAFTVQADARKGRRPSFEQAASPEFARGLYNLLCETLAGMGVLVHRGSFGKNMDVHAVNDGPICLLLDSRRTF